MNAGSGTPPTPGPANAPWLTAEQQQLATVILNSHQRGFGSPLLAGLPPGLPDLQQAQALFAAPRVVLAHDGGSDPKLIYANAQALALWRRPWAAMVGLASRLTAEAQERPGRAQMLAEARSRQAISGYSGIRIDSAGRRFQIRGARLWTLWDRHGQAIGQAASFSDWWWL
jgi:hypothetical protein